MNDRELRLSMGAAAKRAADERFGEAPVMQRWRQLFESLARPAAEPQASKF